MKIEKTGGVWVAVSSYDERVLPKAAGFWWHPGPVSCTRRSCKACAAGLDRTWWTPDVVTASRLVQYADGAVKAELEGLKATQAASKATDAAIDIPRPDGLEYLPFQKAGIAYALPRPGVLIGDEMGLGKTIQAVGVINADATIKKVLVVCPSTLRVNWSRELEKWLVRPLKLQVIHGREIPDEASDVVIFNYEKVVGPRGNDLFNWIMAREWDLLISDEAHYLKTPGSQRTKTILGKRARKEADKGEPGIASRCRRKLLLTGTPLLNRPVELFGLLNALAPETFPSFFGYAKRYCAAYQSRWGWDFSGASNLEELQEKMRSTCLVRRIKKDVLKELPPIRRQVVPLAVNGAQDEVDEEIEVFSRVQEDLERAQAEVDLAHAAGDDESYKAAVQKLRKVSGVAFSEMARVRHDTAVAKIPAVIEHLDTLMEELDKLVVFAHHHDVVDALEHHFKDSCVVITGNTPQEDRMGLVDRFQNDASVKVFIGSITAAGVGITLTAASVVAFAELDWVPANVSQAEARLHRIGQTDSVLVQHLVFDGSLDSKMAKMIVAKQAVMDRAMDLPFERDLPVLSPSGVARPSKYPPATDSQKAAALRGLRMLAGVCDGAVADDDMGYNGADAFIGHRLAALQKLTDGQYWLARRILPKYHRQLGEEILKEIGYELKKNEGA